MTAPWGKLPRLSDQEQFILHQDPKLPVFDAKLVRVGAVLGCREDPYFNHSLLCPGSADFKREVTAALYVLLSIQFPAVSAGFAMRVAGPT